MKKLSYQDVKDILVGCTILGTGGGGDIEIGLNALQVCITEGKEFKLIGVDEINEEGYYVTSAFTGVVSDDAVLSIEEELKMLKHSVKVLEQYMDTEFEGIMSSECGGANTGEGMAIAAMLDKYIVDCDAVGRAVPFLQQSTYYITGQPMCPFSVTTKYGDSTIITNTVSDERSEEIARAIAIASGNIVALSDHPMQGKNIKNSVIPNAMTYAGKLGKAQREAVEKGIDPVQNIIEAGEGYLLFKGIVNKDSDWETKDGFTFGNIYIDGIDEFESQKFRLWYQNEHMISWKNGEIFVTCPDLLCTVDNKSGYPITNPNCTEGKEIAVLGFKAHEFWRMGKGFDLLNPQVFGYNIDYKPIENLFK